MKFQNKILLFISASTAIILSSGISLSPQQIIEDIVDLTHSKIAIAQQVGQQNPGSLGIQPIHSPVTGATLSVTGDGLGGIWRRAREHCMDSNGNQSGTAYGYFAQALVNSNPQTPGDTPEYHNPPTVSTYHPHPLPSRAPRYKIDGQDQGTYVLTEVAPGASAPIDCDNPGGGEYFPYEYSFQFNVDVSGLANGLHTVTVDAYDESTEQIIITQASFTIQHNYALNCDITQSVFAGAPAQFAVSIGGSGVGGIFEVTMTSPPPPGPPTMTNSGLLLNAGNGYSAVANVATDGLTPGTTYDLIFTAVNGGTSLNCPAQLIVISPEPPQVNIFFNGSGGPVSLPEGVTKGTISWRNSDVTSCTASTSPSDVNPPWNGSTNVTPIPEGSLDVGELAISTTYTFSLNCTGPGGNDTDSVMVIPAGAPVSPPTVDIKCTSLDSDTPIDGPCSVVKGTAGLLTWESQFADTCSIDPDIGAVPLQEQAGMNTANIEKDITFTITCIGPGTPDAVDSVTFDIVPELASFSLSCKPASITLAQGDTGSYGLKTGAIGPFKDSVNFTIANIVPTPGTAADISFVDNDLVPSAGTTAVVTTNTSTSLGTYTLTIAGTGGKITKQCDVQLTITAIANPEPPINVAASNTQCDTIDITWSNPSSGPNPDSFRVYHRLTNKAPWVQIGSDIPFQSSGDYTISHTTSDYPPLSTDVSNYYAVAAVYGSTQSSKTLSSPSSIIPLSCNPNIKRSDKDVVSVQGKINKTFNPIACSGESEIASLPNNAVFSVGDKVTFQINVCNSGPGELTAASILDTLSNLSNPEKATSPQDCLLGQSYDSKTNTIVFDLKDIKAGDVVAQSCSVVFTATVTAPAVTTAALYRFQNIADISTKELGVNRVLTPPYLFSIAGGVPDRTETAPN